MLTASRQGAGDRERLERKDRRTTKKNECRAGEFVEEHGRALVIVVLSFAIAGMVLIFQIPIAILPQTDFPRIVILADSGVQPVDVQMLTVTRPLEEAIRLVPGITDVRSITSRGGTEINMHFSIGEPTSTMR